MSAKKVVNPIKDEAANAKKTSSKTKKVTETVKQEDIIEIANPQIVEVNCIADAMLDKKGQNVCSMDLKKIGTAICDYFVICNADSKPQVMAIADNVEEMMLKNCNRKVMRMQGKENAFWIILDYGDIVVHVFQTEYRQFYRLEDLWADAEKNTYQD